MIRAKICTYISSWSLLFSLFSGLRHELSTCIEQSWWGAMVRVWIFRCQFVRGMVLRGRWMHHERLKLSIYQVVIVPSHVVVVIISLLNVTIKLDTFHGEWLTDTESISEIDQRWKLILLICSGRRGSCQVKTLVNLSCISTATFHFSVCRIAKFIKSDHCRHLIFWVRILRWANWATATWTTEWGWSLTWRWWPLRILFLMIIL